MVSRVTSTRCQRLFFWIECRLVSIPIVSSRCAPLTVEGFCFTQAAFLCWKCWKIAGLAQLGRTAQSTCANQPVRAARMLVKGLFCWSWFVLDDSLT